MTMSIMIQSIYKKNGKVSFENYDPKTLKLF